MHLFLPHFPRPHAHPLLGLADYGFGALIAAATTPIQRFGVAVDQLTAVVIQLSALAVAMLWLIVRVKLLVQTAKQNSERIQGIIEDKEADKIAVAEAVAKAKAETKAAADAEIARLNEEIRKIRHAANNAADVAGKVAAVVEKDLADRDRERKSNDPDAPPKVSHIVVDNLSDFTGKATPAKETGRG